LASVPTNTLQTDGVSELNVIGIVDGAAVGLELVALTATGQFAVTPTGAGPKAITWFALPIVNVRGCGVAAL
jgi:hypothetical protein